MASGANAINRIRTTNRLCKASLNVRSFPLNVRSFLSLTPQQTNNWSRIRQLSGNRAFVKSCPFPNRPAFVSHFHSSMKFPSSSPSSSSSSSSPSASENKATTASNSTPATPSSSVPESAKKDLVKENFSKFKIMFRKYGFVFVGTYFTIYGLVLLGFYFCISNNYFGSVDVIDLAKRWGLERFVSLDEIRPQTGQLTLAWIATKITEPVRLALAIAITPVVARRLPAFIKTTNKSTTTATTATQTDSKQTRL